ncbi:hypothetical protein AVV36_gp141 [Pectobacterium bacteriophage PM2]|uniref:Uncharacterized protein n=1 Tax=Pectobacterium bacteriophage PM2 TaxID=1429794 RepID=A0A0A0Q0P8_9CAUD|nr:hypothetical protein AVV36_gp141 [Pectobacterium bacteriophage PM2]AHY25103.1 hypothetical protein PM2_141 [Pectobacterium bacteriophage PM2]
MSVNVECAIRTATAALNNLIQIAKDEGESEVDIWLDFDYDGEGTKCLTLKTEDWASSSYSC